MEMKLAFQRLETLEEANLRLLTENRMLKRKLREAEGKPRRGRPPKPKRPYIAKLRVTCQHPHAVERTGLLPWPEKRWLWCPDCLLMKEVECGS